MDVSVVVPTYNRCGLLDQAISVLLNQEAPGLRYEVIIVDNNSTDATRRTVESYASGDGRVRYAFEQRQGVAYARNTGIRLAAADVIAFCDDDVSVARDWVANLHQAFVRFPDADFVGGKVLPKWAERPPSWLRPTMCPLALQDRGEEAVFVSLRNPICLISANLGVRRRVFDRVGLFDPATQRVKDGIGSTEDYDWELKVWRSGGHGVYVPDVVCYCDVPPGRMKKAYHRRWHLGHGRFNALARRAEFNGGRQFLDVPLFLYRQLIESAATMPKQLLMRDVAETFERETHGWFCLGFISERWRNYFISNLKKSPQPTDKSIQLTARPRPLSHAGHEVQDSKAA
jgi:glucosyl-dolichyl phosphate glucuronosyltransferase